MRKLISLTTALAHKRKNLLTEAGKYLIVGGICTVLDFGILYLLTRRGAMHPVPASVISFMAGTVLNYYLCILWIFKVRAVANRHLEMTYYLIITGVGLGINALLIWLCTSYFGYSVMMSKLAATGVTFWWNFGARKYFLHRSAALQPAAE